MLPRVQECLTPETTIQLLEACKKGTPPPLNKWGRCGGGLLGCRVSLPHLPAAVTQLVAAPVAPAAYPPSSAALNGQLTCEGPLGKTSLHEIPTTKHFREDIEAKVCRAQQAQQLALCWPASATSSHRIAPRVLVRRSTPRASRRT